ncbi:MAG: hypothetical protein H7A23_19390 [Leptospiraceae bacterium]|nr:hypothetical protein [Leptospiraceae bacterium]MCP5496720.1 hypothetical protein [Leptospiraceae bacterium]
MRYLNNTKYVILFLVLVIIIFSKLLCLNLSSAIDGGDNPVIGELKAKYKLVQRRSDKSVVWKEIKESTPIRNKDTIRTAEYSEAILTLNGGAEIKLDENSMIRIDINDKDINVNFEYGMMTVEGEGLSNDSNLKINNESGKLKDGKVTLLKAAGKESVQAQNEKSSIFLQSPERNQYFKSDKKGSVIPFQWNSKGNVTIEISKSMSFRSTIVRKATNQNSIGINLDKGRYYWRVFKKDSVKEEYSEVRKFFVVETSPLRLTSPKDKDTIYYIDSPPFIIFSWKRGELDSSYRLLLSQTSGFEKTVYDSNTLETFLGVRNLKEGKYYAKVIRNYNIRGMEPESSPVIYFQIVKKTKVPPPALLNPSNNQEVDQKLIVNAELLFNWEDSSFLKEYTFQVAKDSQFQNIIFESKLSKNFIKEKFATDIGKSYYWRVKGKTNGGIETVFSKAFSFQIKVSEKLQLEYPSDGSSLYPEANQGVQLRWKKTNTRGYFLVEVSQDKNFENVIYSVKTANVATNILLDKPGIYHWRTTQFVENIKLSQSVINKFQISKILQSPSPIYPTKGEEVNMQKVQRLVFDWKEQGQVLYYDIELYDKEKQNKLLSKIQSQKPKMELKNYEGLHSGEYVWTLSSVYKKQDGEIVKTKPIKSSFRLILPEEQFKVPEVYTPKKLYIE